MMDLGVITSDIRIRRRVHNPASFPALRHQSRVSGAYTYTPPPVVEREPAEPAPEAAAVVAPTRRYGLRAEQRPAKFLAYLHDLADHDMSLPAPAEIARVIGYSVTDPSDYSHILTKLIAALLKVGAMTAWCGEQNGIQPRLRVFRLADGRIVASPGAPEWVL